MQDFRDAKIMAKALRTALAERRIEISHADSLELVARQFGLTDWNTLSARINKAPLLPLPPGWFPGDDFERHYSMGLDAGRPGAIRIDCLLPPGAADGRFGTLMQSISAEDYRGRRMRLIAELAGRSAGSASIWLRVNAGDGRILAFDNEVHRSEDPAPGGTFDWKVRRIVLDIPHEAMSIHFGALLGGEGTLWARRFRFEPAEPDEAVTGTGGLPRTPRNLDFTMGRDAAASARGSAT